MKAAEKIELARQEGYYRGKCDKEYEIAERNQAQMMQLKRDQILAVTELIKATTSNLSKAGYLLGKLNNEKGW